MLLVMKFSRATRGPDAARVLKFLRRRKDHNEAKSTKTFPIKRNSPPFTLIKTQQGYSDLRPEENGVDIETIHTCMAVH